jgi:hypothetical protein
VNDYLLSVLVYKTTRLSIAGPIQQALNPQLSNVHSLPSFNRSSPLRYQSLNMKLSVFSTYMAFAIASAQGSYDSWAPGGADDCMLTKNSSKR